MNSIYSQRHYPDNGYDQYSEWIMYYSATGESGTFKHYKAHKAYAELDYIKGTITLDEYNRILKYT